MLHTLKQVTKRYKTRILGLFRFIVDYKVLFFSIIFMLATYLGINILRNIDQGVTMGLFFLLPVLSLLLFGQILLLRNIAKSQKEEGETKEGVHKYVHFFVLSLFLALTGLLVLFRIDPIIANERKIKESSVSFTDELVSFEAYVAYEPDKRYRIQQLHLRQLQDIVVEDENLSMEHGYILTRVENYRKFSVGQVCKFRGQLVQPENFADFDYITFLKNQKVFYILDNPTYTCFDLDQRRAGNPFRNFLIDLKEEIVEIIDENLQEPYSTLLAGILFGKKRRLERNFEQNIRKAGIGHVITASGYNITVLIIMINKVLFFLPKKAKVISCLLLIWCFAIFTGLSNSIIRACIMNSLSLVALLFGRDSRVHISLPLASAIFVFLDPLIILNVGFILSISAILGLVYISPILVSIKEVIIKKIKSKFDQRVKLKFLDDYIFPTLSCTIGTLPVSIHTFETFTIWSVPVNAIVLPVIESTMLWGALFLILSTIHTPLSSFFLTIASLQLRYLEYVINIVGEIPYGFWEIGSLMSFLVGFLSLFVIIMALIYFYPIDNERYNYYLKNN